MAARVSDGSSLEEEDTRDPPTKVRNDASNAGDGQVLVQPRSRKPSYRKTATEQSFKAPSTTHNTYGVSRGGVQRGGSGVQICAN